MPKEFKTRIKSKHDTTANWDNSTGFIPLAGEIIIYDDYQTFTYENNGETITINIPGIKIGSGNAYVQDLAFVDEDTRRKLLEHISNQEMHVTLGEKTFWSNKVNIDDSEDIISDELVDETLIFNRN